MKTICAWMLALLLAMTLALPGMALAEEDFEVVEDGEEEVELPRIPEDAEVLHHLNVGNPTPMRGDFFTNMWGNATTDIDVRELLHGYDLIVWNGDEGMFMHNPTVVSALTGLMNEDGSHEFLIALHGDLAWSDGTPITAWDYAFSWLLRVAPEIDELGGVPHRTPYILGYEDYISGNAATLQGIRVLGDHMLSVTIDQAYLPYFFELGLLACRPYPISVIAPGVRVKDDGNGIYLANADPNVTEPVFTAELLRETLMNPETGYISHPSVVCGPYTLTSWDGKVAEFAMNPYFKGDEKGILPVIDTLSFRTADNEHMIDMLRNGELDLLNKVMRQDNIQKGMELLADGTFSMGNYPRVGLSYISFACEKAATASQAVRQAIAWSVDREAVKNAYTGEFYGIKVDGYYGVGQWMYGVVLGSIIPEQVETETVPAITPEMWEEMNIDMFTELLTQYTLDPAAAAALLDGDGWKPGADGIREKEIDGETVRLDLKMIYPEGNNINEVFDELLIPNLEKIGIRLTMEAVPMNELLGRWYGQAERDADMIYLASNFDLLFDPASQFIDDGNGEKSWYYTRGVDSELYQLAEDMNRTEPGNIYEYMQKWIKFQDRFNETLPMLPFYSNIYFDFYTVNLHDYAISERSTWSQAVVDAAMYIAPEVEEEELPEGMEEPADEDGEKIEEFD